MRTRHDGNDLRRSQIKKYPYFIKRSRQTRRDCKSHRLMFVSRYCLRKQHISGNTLQEETPSDLERPFFGRFVRSKQTGNRRKKRKTKKKKKKRHKGRTALAGAIAGAIAEASRRAAVEQRERRRNLGWRPRDTQVGVAPIPTRRTGSP